SPDLLGGDAGPGGGVGRLRAAGSGADGGPAVRQEMSDDETEALGPGADRFGALLAGAGDDSLDVFVGDDGGRFSRHGIFSRDLPTLRRARATPCTRRMILCFKNMII